MTEATLSVDHYDGTTHTALHNPAGGYTCFLIAVSSMTWQHTYAESNGRTDGDLRIVSVLKNAQRQLGIRIKGTSYADYVTKRDALIALLWKSGTTVTITWNSQQIEQWKNCSPADYELGQGGQLDRFRLFNKDQEYTFTFESDPR